MTREEKRHRDGKEQANRYSNQSDPKIFISDSFEPERDGGKGSNKSGDETDNIRIQKSRNPNPGTIQGKAIARPRIYPQGY
jgi:hypothetical protein